MTSYAVHPHKPVHMPDTFQRTPYHLSEEQVHFFDENGYLILRKWIPKELLQKLQEAGSGWIRQGWELEAAGKIQQEAWDKDFVFVNRAEKKVMYRVNYLHNKGYPVSLELLGSPQVLAVAESMCGVNFVPTYESMVFKQEDDGAAIRWHQDAIHPRNYRIFNYDIYLDASRSGAGALRVVPKTQTRKQDFCNITDLHGWEIPESFEVEMEPGDVLLHDVMVAHGSPETIGKALRRTLYYEFRAAEQILEEGPWDRDWIDKRMRLLPLALNRYSQAYPDSLQFEWKAQEAFRPQAYGDEEVELKVAHLVHTQGAFCSAGDVAEKGSAK
jgi:ectoine hydroxylase-related dioxygenase (phytanoyl-CoA dioxygenase family)